MDLSKAKTLLIVTFLFLNIFLVSQILLDEGRGNLASFGRNEEMSRLETALQEAGISLDVSLPRGGLRIAHLIVEPWRFQPEDIIYELWSVLEKDETEVPPIYEEYDSIANDENLRIVTYLFGDYTLVERKEGSLNLRALEEGSLLQTNSIEELQNSAQKFLNDFSFLNNFIYDYAQISQKGPILNYRQEYEEFPLYAGYLQLYMHELNPAGFYLYRLDPIGFAEQKREIIPPSTALVRFLETYNKSNFKTSIIEFSLGYYSQEYDAERWEIPPVWRIRLNNGEVYYVNAFTGNLER
ncbi:MAG: two-component system regulatory protein YycI [Bacillota bacterium]|nr:two-component system regulatory protein YycI [Bacillota bacterium]